ncbi:hypothetical protein ACUHMQ_01575 [Chitinimonas sp. PSY-7]|uniref:hypothetical protein n=1 Tax=Chitinimonas sp. PSY-7 TaxID=3459088 RepID=UPI00403FF5F4
MELHCPRCTSADALQMAQLDTGLDVPCCEGCHGSWLELSRWRDWRSTQPAAIRPEPVIVGDPLLEPEAPQVGTCPQCQRLMSRLRVAAGLPFRLDRCVSCQHVWIDGGEWSAMSQYGYQLVLDDVVSDRWQRLVREAEASQAREAAWCERLGTEVYEEILKMRNWLDAQPNRAALMSFLLRDDNKNI